MAEDRIAGAGATLRFAPRHHSIPSMVSEIFLEVREDEVDGGFVARALGHSIVTQAETWDELRANVREAVLCHFDPGSAPKVIRLRIPTVIGHLFQTKSDSDSDSYRTLVTIHAGQRFRRDVGQFLPIP